MDMERRWVASPALAWRIAQLNSQARGHLHCTQHQHVHRIRLLYTCRRLELYLCTPPLNTLPPSPTWRGGR